MERLPCRNRIDLVHSYAERYLARHPGIEQRWAQAASAATAGQPGLPINDLSGGDRLVELARVSTCWR